VAASLSRRRLLKLSAGSLLAMHLWPGRLQAADTSTKPLKFLVVNDLHYFNEQCNPFFEGLFRAFNAVPEVAFVLIVGDLIESGTLAQANAMHDLLKVLKCPYYVTSGNHDSKSNTDREGFENAFGNKLNFTFDAAGWQFVGLDTSSGTKASQFDCHKETLEFAGRLPTLLDKSKPTFLYTHFPLGPGVRNRLQNADALLEPLKPLNLTAIFNGHYHAFTERKLPTDAVVTTNCCCSFHVANHDRSWQKGFFIIEAADGKARRTFVDYGTDFPGAAHPRGDAPTTRPVSTTSPSF
jgi:hypothetical protein